MTEDERVALVRDLFEEWNQRRGELTLRHFDPGLVFDTRGLPQPDFQGLYHGLEEYFSWARTWLSAWDNAQQHPVWVEASGDRVAAWAALELVGRHSGITDDLYGGWGFTFRDDKIVAIRLMTGEDATRGYLTE